MRLSPSLSNPRVHRVALAVLLACQGCSGSVGSAGSGSSAAHAEPVAVPPPPPAAAAEAPPPTPPPLVSIVAPGMPGVRFSVGARPVEQPDGWALDIELVASSDRDDRVIFAGAPAPQLRGELELERGAEPGAGFADGCYAVPERSDHTLLPKSQLRWSRRLGDQAVDLLVPGQTLHLEVGFCMVQVGDAWLDPIVAKLSFELSADGVPSVRVEPASSALP